MPGSRCLWSFLSPTSKVHNGFVGSWPGQETFKLKSDINLFPWRCQLVLLVLFWLPQSQDFQGWKTNEMWDVSFILVDCVHNVILKIVLLSLPLDLGWVKFYLENRMIYLYTNLVFYLCKICIIYSSKNIKWYNLFILHTFF